MQTADIFINRAALRRERDVPREQHQTFASAREERQQERKSNTPHSNDKEGQTMGVAAPSQLPSDSALI